MASLAALSSPFLDTTSSPIEAKTMRATHANLARLLEIPAVYTAVTASTAVVRYNWSAGDSPAKTAAAIRAGGQVRAAFKIALAAETTDELYGPDGIAEKYWKLGGADDRQDLEDGEMEEEWIDHDEISNGEDERAREGLFGPSLCAFPGPESDDEASLVPGVALGELRQRQEARMDPPGPVVPLDFFATCWAFFRLAYGSRLKGKRELYVAMRKGSSPTPERAGETIEAYRLPRPPVKTGGFRGTL